MKMTAGDRQTVGYLRSLAQSLGLKGAVSENDLEKMKRSFFERDYVPCIYLIQRYLRIELTLLVKFTDQIDQMFSNVVSLPPLPSLTWFGLSEMDDLIDSVSFNDKSEPASIELPEPFPFWDSQGFKKLRLKMKIRKYLRAGTFESFATVVAHEMSHIILHATHHQLMTSEIATDLCAMTQGFYEVMRRGIKTHDSRIGYLDKRRFKLAYHWIRSQKGTLAQQLLSSIWLKLNKIQA